MGYYFEEGPNRPPMLQTYAPFVEMYIKGRDILRSANGRPRSLVAFSHDILVGSYGGIWTLEIFDPDYVAVEELLLDLQNYADTPVSDEAYGGEEGKELSNWVVSGAMFRYGYVGMNEEKIIRTGPNGEKFFFGNVHSYVPTYQAEGTYITLRGDSLRGGAGNFSKERTYEASHNEPPYETIKRVAKDEDWILIPVGNVEVTGGDGEEPIPEEQQPFPLMVCHDQIDSTEEAPKTVRKRENQSSAQFIDELCQKFRPSNPEYNSLIARWESWVDATVDEEGNAKAEEGDVKTYLYYGAQSVKNPIVRSFHYLRDAQTDIISFTPSVNVWLTAKSGAAGVTYKNMDVRTGELDAHVLNLLNRELAYFHSQRNRPPLTSRTLAEFRAAQKGWEEFLVREKKPEGAGADSNEIGPAEAKSPDTPPKEMSVYKKDKHEASTEMMAHWVAMPLWAKSASLTIFGDPSPELQPGNLIAVYVYVPGEGDQIRLHWLSTMWIITTVSHNIQAGSFTTNLEINRMGIGDGGIYSGAFYQRLIDDLGEAGMKRAGG